MYDKRKKLRENSSPPEDILWEYLRNKKLGVKFRRQHPFKMYVLDFYCVSEKLNIEIDGHDHKYYLEDDLKRDTYLKEDNIKVLRFFAGDVFNNIDKVLEGIKSALV